MSGLVRKLTAAKLSIKQMTAKNSSAQQEAAKLHQLEAQLNEMSKENKELKVHRSAMEKRVEVRKTTARATREGVIAWDVQHDKRGVLIEDLIMRLNLFHYFVLTHSHLFSLIHPPSVSLSPFLSLFRCVCLFSHLLTVFFCGV